jgi:hypothetical protein
MLVGSTAKQCSAGSCESDETSLLQESTQLKKAIKRHRTHANATKAKGDDFGDDGCPCIGVNNVEGVIFGKVDQGDGMPDGVSFPADIGARCDTWDDDSTDPECPDADWCSKKWCYVDACNCKGLKELPTPSGYLRDAEYKGHGIFFSYATCGAKDTYTAKDTADDRKDEIEKACSADAEEELWGKADCQCTGFTPEEGVVQVLNGKTVLEYQADYGANCAAWDSDNDPACMEDGAPSYCEEKWCYVSSDCKQSGVKTSHLIPDATVDGDPIQYSYETCGGTNNYD